MIRSSLVFCLVVALGCDTFEDRIRELNDPPEFRMDTLSISSYSDSVKASAGSYPFKFMFYDKNNNLNRLSYASISKQEGVLMLNDAVVNGSVSLGRIEEESFVYESVVAGTHLLRFSLYDDFDASAELFVSLVFFENVKPVVVYSVEKTSFLNTYVADASASYDGDASHGGSVTRYELQVSDRAPLQRDGSTFRFTFSAMEDFDVTMRAQDNEGLWSDKVKKTIKIN